MTNKQLKAIRNKLGLSQAELAERLKVSRVSVTRMEYGSQVITPSMGLLIGYVAHEVGNERQRQRAANTPGDEDKRVGSSSNLRLHQGKQQDVAKSSKRRSSKKT
jgi:DNA-binding XRE family transcriptional regulator